MTRHFTITPSPHIPSRLNASRRVAGGRVNWITPEAYETVIVDTGEWLRSRMAISLREPALSWLRHRAANLRCRLDQRLQSPIAAEVEDALYLIAYGLISATCLALIAWSFQ